MRMDEPKSLRSIEECKRRLSIINAPHVAPLSAFVERLRESMGDEYKIPYFDPLDGGTKADCLFLLEAPGPKAVTSRFISRNNPDESAKNFFLLNKEAGIDRRRTVVWNIVPWYIGTGKKIRPANMKDIGDAETALRELSTLLPALHSVVLVGNKASSGKSRKIVNNIFPNAHVSSVPHPSPLFVNNRPENRGVLLQKLREVASNLPPWSR